MVVDDRRAVHRDASVFMASLALYLVGAEIEPSTKTASRAMPDHSNIRAQRVHPVCLVTVALTFVYSPRCPIMRIWYMTGVGGTPAVIDYLFPSTLSPEGWFL